MARNAPPHLANQRKTSELKSDFLSSQQLSLFQSYSWWDILRFDPWMLLAELMDTGPLFLLLHGACCIEVADQWQGLILWQCLKAPDNFRWLLAAQEQNLLFQVCWNIYFIFLWSKKEKSNLLWFDFCFSFCCLSIIVSFLLASQTADFPSIFEHRYLFGVCSDLMDDFCELAGPMNFRCVAVRAGVGTEKLFFHAP